MKRAGLLAFACVLYAEAAWLVAPAFYDGFPNPTPYAWTCPPPQAGANVKPKGGHVDVKITGGVSEADSAFTEDGQIVIGFLPGAFNADGKSIVSVDITAPSTCAASPGVKFVTNVYEITADAQLVKDSNLTMVFSNLELPPTAIYTSASADGPWRSIGAQNQAQPYTIWQHVHDLGYFAAGYPVSSRSATPTLPIIVAVLIAIVVLAGLPLAVLRRRRTGAGEEEDGEEDGG